MLSDFSPLKWQLSNCTNLIIGICRQIDWKHFFFIDHDVVKIYIKLLTITKYKVKCVTICNLKTNKQERVKFVLEFNKLF